MIHDYLHARRRNKVQHLEDLNWFTSSKKEMVGIEKFETE